MTRLTMKETGANYLAVLFADDPGKYEGREEREIMVDLDATEESLEILDAVRAETIRRGI